MLFPLTRTEYAAAQGLPWYQWASLNAPVAPAQVCNPYLWKYCAWQRILCLKSMAGLLLWCGSWSVTFPYALSFLPVFISCIGFIIHPSKAFLDKIATCRLIPSVVYRTLYQLDKIQDRGSKQAILPCYGASVSAHLFPEIIFIKFYQAWPWSQFYRMFPVSCHSWTLITFRHELVIRFNLELVGEAPVRMGMWRIPVEGKDVQSQEGLKLPAE